MKKFKIKRLRIFPILGVLLLMFGLTSLFDYFYTEYRFQKSIEGIEQIKAEVEVAVETGFDRETVLKKRNEDMLALNSDYVAWVRLKFTDIDFPVMHAQDNAYYLEHDYTKKKHAYGSIFMDYRNSRNLQEEHIILYGHSVQSQAMFGLLERFKDESYLAGRNIIEVVTEDRILEYQIFSVQIVDADLVGLDNPASVRNVDKLYQKFKEQSLYVIEDMGIDIEQIITLVSCEYSYENGRILVHATLINEQNLK